METRRPRGRCRRWRGRIRSDGYGTIGSRLAHRVFYEAEHGPIPDGLVLDHLCEVRDCVNPDHMEPVTQAENVRRSAARGRHHCARKDRCPYDHDPEDYVRGSDGIRYCRTCKRLRSRRDRAGV